MVYDVGVIGLDQLKLSVLSIGIDGPQLNFDFFKDVPCCMPICGLQMF
jgi:hypothetical protein